MTLCARGVWGVVKDELGDCPGLCSEPRCPHGSSNMWKEVKMGDVTLQVLKMEEGLLTAAKSRNGVLPSKRMGSSGRMKWGSPVPEETIPPLNLTQRGPHETSAPRTVRNNTWVLCHSSHRDLTDRKTKVWKVDDLPCLDPAFMEASGDWLSGHCEVRASRPPM